MLNGICILHALCYYILVFYKNDIEIARVLYNDIAYQDSAAKIMNGEILKPHIVDLWRNV